MRELGGMEIRCNRTSCGVLGDERRKAVVNLCIRELKRLEVK